MRTILSPCIVPRKQGTRNECFGIQTEVWLQTIRRTMQRTQPDNHKPTIGRAIPAKQNAAIY